MDVVYFYKHSQHQDTEIRYSLRSIARYFPDVGKVWILGDKPSFLAAENSLVEHLPTQSMAATLGLREPVRNFFQLLLCAAIVPDLQSEFLLYCDDYVLLQPFPEPRYRTIYYLEDLQKVSARGKGPWIDSLWRTSDILGSLGYPCLNFETHTPTFFRKRWILDAYADLQDWICNDPLHGILGISATLNHALRHHRFPIESITDRQLRAGFYGRPCRHAELDAIDAGKAFLNFGLFRRICGLPALSPA